MSHCFRLQQKKKKKEKELNEYQNRRVRIVIARKSKKVEEVRDVNERRTSTL